MDLIVIARVLPYTLFAAFFWTCQVNTFFAVLNWDASQTTPGT
jgi:hypothetical protein